MMIERDPNGKSANQPGSKLDADKSTYALTMGYFPRAFAAINSVSNYGAQKYVAFGWESVPDGVARYTEAMLRHQFRELSREKIDADTGLLHAAHAAWNALARLELMLREQPEISGNCPPQVHQPSAKGDTNV
jgi:hypothetical protein